jgi:methionyl aminopeptidase
VRKNQLEKIEKMTRGGKILGTIMSEACDFARVGISTLQIEYFVRERFAFYRVEPSFTKVKNYQYYTCLSVNDVVVHGVPSAYILNDQDILGIDIGVYLEGFHTDMSWSKLIKKDGQKKDRYINQEEFLKAGAKSLQLAIGQAMPGKRIGDISRMIQTSVEGFGFNVVKQLVGHAVGKNLHEYPQIPGILTKNIDQTEEISAGMTLAIEIIYTMGKPDIVYKNNDGWSIATKDKSLSGLFEATVAVVDDGNKVLTPFTQLLNT